MIYPYYCVECGRLQEGSSICFDLTELLGFTLSSGTNSREYLYDMQALVSSEDLQYLAEQSGEKLHHKTRIRMTITLPDYLRFLRMREADKKLPEDISYPMLGGYIAERIENPYADPVVLAEKFRKLFDQCFAYDETEEIEETEEPASLLPETGTEEQEERVAVRDKLSGYKASFWIQPEFFENGDSQSVYTLEYASEDKVNFNQLLHPLPIRGYCPCCGAPVLTGAGQHPHMLIGMVGPAGSGKTSVIMSMMKKIEGSYRSLDLKYPQLPLCDRFYDWRTSEMSSFYRDWEVKPSENSGCIPTYSLLLTSSDETVSKILTFVDIAGEMCYDARTRQVNPKAFDLFPLISCCDVYFLCSGLKQPEEGAQAAFYDPDDENVVRDTAVPDDAGIQILRNLYGRLRFEKRIPPLCVLVTKMDCYEALEQYTSTRQFPMEQLQTDRQYQYADNLSSLKSIYEQYMYAQIQKPIEWAVRAYEEMKLRTYTAILCCSAAGKTKSLQGAEDDAAYDAYSSRNMDVLWKWLLQLIGFMPVSLEKEAEAYRLHDVPSYTDSYASDEIPEKENGRYVFSLEESRKRIQCVQKLFLNPSVQDLEILKLWDHSPSRLEKIGGYKAEKKIAEFLNQ